MMKLILAAAALFLAPALHAQFKVVAPASTYGLYAAKEFPAFAAGTTFSFGASSLHLKLYQGYVKNVNALQQRFKELEDEGKADTPEYAELKRRFGWEFNGMRLHELYFAQFGAAPLAEKADLRQALAAQYGSFEAWQKAFLALTQARGIGWAALVYDRPAKRFHNVWINEHDGGVPAGAELLLLVDLFEHAFLPDFQLEKARYVQAAWAGLNWPVVGKRFAGK
jgi:Fe-Mn family superoxide dismutase